MSEPEGADGRYGTIVVVGGGCYGGYYVRQLGRGVRAGAIEADRVIVVDQDPECAVAATLAGATAEAGVPFTLAVAEWRAFFTRYLVDAADAADAHRERDAIVPSPLMPHLMGEWLVSRARDAFGDRVETRPFEAVPAVPWERAGADGTHYVSFATWMCPINCVEPRLCPHTRDVRDWSLPVTIARHTAEARAAGGTLHDAVLFCRHRAFGVGMFDTQEVLSADARIREAGARGEAEFIIGTVSHCHGALTRLVIAAPSGVSNSQRR